MEKSKKLAHLTSRNKTTLNKVPVESVNNAQIEQLQSKVSHLESEVGQLKKQVNQLISFIKKKLQ